MTIEYWAGAACLLLVVVWFYRASQISAKPSQSSGWKLVADSSSRERNRRHTATQNLGAHTHANSRANSSRAFGRISLKMQNVIAQHVKDLTGPVMSYLPLSVSREMRDFTLYKSLQTLFKDSLENENCEALSPEDIRDFGSFIELAFSISARERQGELSEVDEAVYKAVLSGLLQDWLHNWNAEETGVSEPG